MQTFCYLSKQVNFVRLLNILNKIDKSIKRLETELKKGYKTKQKILAFLKKDRKDLKNRINRIEFHLGIAPNWFLCFYLLEPSFHFFPINHIPPACVFVRVMHSVYAREHYFGRAGQAWINCLLHWVYFQPRSSLRHATSSLCILCGGFGILDSKRVPRHLAPK